MGAKKCHETSSIPETNIPSGKLTYPNLGNFGKSWTQICQKINGIVLVSWRVSPENVRPLDPEIPSGFTII